MFAKENEVIGQEGRMRKQGLWSQQALHLSFSLLAGWKLVKSLNLSETSFYEYEEHGPHFRSWQGFEIRKRWISRAEWQETLNK